MGSDINIEIAGNASKFVRATGDVEEGLEKVSDSLDDMTRDTKRGADQAERAVDDLARSFDDTRKKAQRLGDAGDDAGRGIKRGMDDAEDGVRRFGDQTSEVGDELRQNLGETFSSFRGDLEDLPQIAQDTLGGLAGSGALGGIPGLAATAAGAAGLGLIIGAFQNIEEERQRLEERANSLAQAYIDAGTTVLDTVTLASRVSEVLTTPEQRTEAEKLVDVLGVSLPEAARILAGDTNALSAAQQVLAEKNAALNEQREDGKLLTEEEAAALADQQLALDGAADSLGTYADNNKTAAQTAREYSDALLGMVRDAGSAGLEIDDLGNKLLTLPDNTQVMIDAQTGQATTDVTKFKGDTDGIIDQLNGEQIVLNLSTGEAIRLAQDAANRIAGIPDRNASVNLDTSGATNGLENWISQNNGRTLKIYGKYVSPVGGQIP